jgi:uncharacterized protein YbcI
VAEYLRVFDHVGFLCFCRVAVIAWSELMDQFQTTTDHRLGQAIHDCEKQQTSYGRRWQAVFLNEETMVIAIHGCLTAVEKVLTQNPVGAFQARKFSQHHFANIAAFLTGRIKGITGMEVIATTVEIEPTTGSVVLIFKTDTVAEECLQPSLELNWPQTQAGGPTRGPIRCAHRRVDTAIAIHG